MRNPTSSSYVAAITLALGPNEIIFETADLKGNSAFDTLKVVYAVQTGVDITPPSLQISQPQDGKLTSAAEDTVKVIAQDRSGISKVLINGVDAAVLNDFYWFRVVPAEAPAAEPQESSAPKRKPKR
jgi:hypothetical protein